MINMRKRNLMLSSQSCDLCPQAIGHHSYNQTQTISWERRQKHHESLVYPFKKIRAKIKKQIKLNRQLIVYLFLFLENHHMFNNGFPTLSNQAQNLYELFKHWKTNTQSSPPCVISGLFPVCVDGSYTSLSHKHLCRMP